jgi:hypothetical protein
MKHWFTIAALALVASAPAARAQAAPADAPADFSGVWSFAGEVQGVEVTETCTLTQSADAKVAGSCDTSAGGKFDAAGAVTGKTLIFHHGGQYNGTDLVMTYTGKVGSDGIVTGTIDVDPFGVSGSFTAKKGTAPAAK